MKSLTQYAGNPTSTYAVESHITTEQMPIITKTKLDTCRNWWDLHGKVWSM